MQQRRSAKVRQSSTATSGPRAGTPGTYRIWLGVVLLVLGVFLVYKPVWRGGVLWDDDRHLTMPHLEGMHGLRLIWFGLGATMQYYPVTHTVFWVEHRLWGDATLGHHLVNIALHLCTALLFWRVLVRLNIPGALFAAALFALHPLQVESVAWMSELKNTLSGTLGLAAMLTYLRFEDSGRKRWYVLAVVGFVLGLLAKSVIAMLPVGLLVVYWWRDGKLNRTQFRRIAPFIVIGVIAGLFTAWVERAYIGAVGQEYSLSAVQRVLIAGRAACFYLAKIVWPGRQVFIYPRWEVSAAAAWQYLFPLAIVITLAALWLIRRHSRGPIAALAIYLILLFPALGFLNVYPFKYSYVADHFQYLACMPIFALAAAGAARVAHGLEISGRVAMGVAGTGLLLLLGALSWRQSHIYKDAQTLYTSIIQGNPNCWMAYGNRGVVLRKQGRLEEALADFDREIALKPDMADSYYNRGVAKAEARTLVDAMADYTKAIQLDPTHVQAYINRGSGYELLAMHDSALADFGRAIELDPKQATAYFNRSTIENNLGRFDQSIQDCNRAIELRPDYAEAYSNRAMAWGAKGEFAKSLADCNRAIGLKPELAVAYHNRLITCMFLKNYDQAWADVRTLRKLGMPPGEPLLRGLIEASGRRE